MANELTLNAAVEYVNALQSFDAKDFDLVAQRLTVSGTDYIRGTITATSTSTVLPKGNLGTLGLFIGKNRGTVAVNLRPSESGTTLVSFPAGIGYWCYLSSNTPYVITAVDPAVFDYMILEA